MAGTPCGCGAVSHNRGTATGTPAGCPTQHAYGTRTLASGATVTTVGALWPNNRGLPPYWALGYVRHLASGQFSAVGYGHGGCGTGNVGTTYSTVAAAVLAILGANYG